MILTSVKYTVAIGISVLVLIYLSIIGPSNIFHTLGWASSLILIIVLLPFLGIKVEAYYKDILIYVVLLIGFVFLNHLTFFFSTREMHFLSAKDKMNGVVFMFIIVQPFAIIFGSFGGLFDKIIKKAIAPNDKMLMNLRWIPLYILICSMWIGLLIIFRFTKNDFTAIHIFTLLAFISTIVSFFFLKRLTYEDIEYVLVPIIRVKTKLSQIRNYLGMVFLFLGLFILLEFYRGLWTFSIICYLMLFFITLNLFIFYKHVFLPATDQLARPEILHIPMLWDKRFLLINYVIFMIACLLAVII